MEFKTKYTPRNRQDYQQKHEQKVFYTYLETNDEKTGKRKLVKDKEVDIYEKIQAYKDESNIKTLIAKYDLKAQQKIIKEGEQIINLVGQPENMMEMLNIIAKQKNIFAQQSKEFKQHFNNSFEEYIASSENGKLAEYLTRKGVIKEQTVAPVPQQTTIQMPEQPVLQTQPITQQGATTNE